jgi:predicted AAA+ superfamily ATPase
MEKLYPRFLQKSQQSYFLFGPRGTGKSTFLKLNYPEALLIDLLLPDIYRNYLARPERLIEIVKGNPEKRIIIIDEVQRVPEILTVIHHLIEAESNRQFIVTGSSARKLKITGIDLLAGRLLLRTMHPFMLSEINQSQTFEKALEIGLLPVVFTAANPREVLETYVALYIREEVQLESRIRNIGNFYRFLESLSFSHGSVLNISNVARECQIERKVVEGYLKILEDILLAFRLPVFIKKAQRALISHSKFYFFDTGIYRTIRPAGPLDRPEEIGGMALEGLVAQHLNSWCAYSSNKWELYFWRSLDGQEVDFVLYGQDTILAIEVKNTKIVRSVDLRGLKVFLKDYPQSQAILLYRGKEKLLINNILCLPCSNFLNTLKPGKIGSWSKD